MPVNTQELANALAEVTPFSMSVGADFIEVSDASGMIVDNIVVAGENITWGSKNEYMLTADKPIYLARAIASTLKDVA